MKSSQQNVQSEIKVEKNRSRCSISFHYVYMRFTLKLNYPAEGVKRVIINNGVGGVVEGVQPS